jgi:hypothetical protein
MAKVVVTYTAKLRQVIDWPDEELDCFNLHNLEANIEIDESDVVDEIEIVDINLNGKEHYF